MASVMGDFERVDIRPFHSIYHNCMEGKKKDKLFITFDSQPLTTETVLLVGRSAEELGSGQTDDGTPTLPLFLLLTDPNPLPFPIS